MMRCFGVVNDNAVITEDNRKACDDLYRAKLAPKEFAAGTVPVHESDFYAAWAEEGDGGDMTGRESCGSCCVVEPGSGDGTSAPGYGDGGGKNATPLAAATLLRSGYRPEPPVPRNRGSPACSAAATTAGGEGSGGADRGSRRHADDWSERATILESRRRASAPGRRNRWWWLLLSDARGVARKRRSIAGRRRRRRWEAGRRSGDVGLLGEIGGGTSRRF
ncbi:LOW QUALITY PROTEIN: hypothetical protein SETIT_1G077700v2 [Setaria italica]|uniref:Uncharacterized protein n=1 Tax=Setaria italica TaxID=4555 RepID=A0A368PJZ3_SETIT|nr:LOW QUALITY PROTEIN: hypothetical protein SETIT_1G077700v2 [Setaria italica]